jgi:hypothetical protein
MDQGRDFAERMELEIARRQVGREDALFRQGEPTMRR